MYACTYETESGFLVGVCALTHIPQVVGMS